MMMTDAQRAMMRSHGVLVGRALLGLLFLISGYNKLTGGVDNFAGYLDTNLGVPLPVLFAWVVVLVEIIGGALLILGYRVGQTAAVLAILLVFTILLAHNPFKNAEQLTAALKNLSILGGMLYVMAYGAGDGWRIDK